MKKVKQSRPCTTSDVSGLIGVVLDDIEGPCPSGILRSLDSLLAPGAGLGDLGMR